MNINLRKSAIAGLITLAIGVSGATSAMAHHSFAAFNIATEKTVTGTVKQVEWTNPHIWIWVEVPNDKGVNETFGFEGMSPNYLERRNWTRTTLKPGDKITVTFNPLRDGKNGGMFRTGKMEGSNKVLSMSGGQ